MEKPLSCCVQSENVSLSIAGRACDFANETEFFNVDGQYYCRFHMPLKDAAGQSTCKILWTEGEELELFNEGVKKRLEHAVCGRTPTIANFDQVVFPQFFSFSQWALSRNDVVLDSVDADDQAKTISFPMISAGSAYFANGADFSGISIPGIANFKGATFVHVAFFNNTRFPKDTSFKNAEFDGIAMFKDAVFGPRVNFTKARFCYDTKFRNSSFDEDANFNSAVFLNSVDFSASKDGPVFKSIIFSGAKFVQPSHGLIERENSVLFTNRIFTDRANFKKAIFQTVPEFYEAKLHQGCTIDEAIFEDTISSKTPSAYRVLKLAMETHSNWIGMAKFHALEERSIRHQSGMPWGTKFMSWAYDGLSEYGQNMWRPLVALAITAFVAFVLYGLTLTFSGVRGNGQLVIDVLAFDVKQMVKPFDAIISGVAIEGLGGLGKFVFGIIATVQTIATAGLVTLFILAVRRRFRMA